MFTNKMMIVKLHANMQVEATKFTELGFVGRDVDEIVKDLMEAALTLTKQRLAAGLRAAAGAVVERLLLQALLGGAEPSTYDAFRCGGGRGGEGGDGGQEAVVEQDGREAQRSSRHCLRARGTFPVVTHRHVLYAC